MDLQALDDTERTEAKFGPEHREIFVEKGGRPANLGEDEDDDLKDDEQTVEDGPECTGRLVGHRAVTASQKRHTSARDRQHERGCGMVMQEWKTRTQCTHNSSNYSSNSTNRPCPPQ